MKNIAVLISSLIVEYSYSILSGVLSFFANKDARIITGQIGSTINSPDNFDYQYWANSELLHSKSIDAVIVLSGSFSSAYGQGALKNLLKLFSDKPLISIAIPTDLPNAYYTKVDTTKTYDELVHHLKSVHGCKKIGFFSGQLVNTSETSERYKSYLAALRSNNLNYDENLVIHGDLIDFNSEKIFLDTYKKKSQIPFDALLCVNDSTAFGAIRAMNKLGVSVPDDVKVIGFDDTVSATRFSPKLSTVDQEIFNQGYKGAEVLWNKLNGKKTEKETVYYPRVVYRQSCGCIPLTHTSDAYKDEKQNIFVEKRILRNSVEQNGPFTNFLNGVASIYALLDYSKTTTTLESIFTSLKDFMFTANFETCAICFYPEPLTLYSDSDFALPSEMKLEMYIDLVTQTELFEPDVTFDPKKTIIPPGTFKKSKGSHIVQPIYSGEKSYGYIIYSIKNDALALYCIFHRLLSNGIAQAYEYTQTILENQQLTDENLQLIKTNKVLNKKSKTDDLTTILNRRGFLELGQQSIDIAVEMHNEGLVFFVDMDGLKLINDTYGHKSGDKAIIAMSKVLTHSLRANDVVGRIGGDEFAIVACGMTQEQVEKFRNKVQTLCETIKAEKGYDFDISCSIGSVEFNAQSHNLGQLLKTADKQMYVEKNRKHTCRKSE